ncbi:hypothetical protein [Stieleria varia]|uniref:Type 4 fimbrial biogenesis protein PilX N-terminal domain-containing protein n=1 Tax=Stieleria varia TaxID=2528005 RepID=A0A5C6B8F9_9BACT|nr:hypothetical protein [Stieleria varia]TWU07536.1 hypothetical protein Pla52n_01090 [Stieleria varia]
MRQHSIDGRLCRAGYVYLAVLFTALIVSAAVAASLSVSTSGLRSQIDRVNRMAAMRLAESEMHRQASRLSSDANWRNNHTDGAYSSWLNATGLVVSSTDQASVRYQLSDVDGDLSDDDFDDVQLTVHARVGDSQSAITVQLQPAYRGLELLGYGVTALDDLRVEWGAVLNSESAVQVADDCLTSTSGTIVSPLTECSGTIMPAIRGAFAGENVAGPTHDVVDVYMQSGTQIPVSSLPWQSGKRTISNAVLTAGTNPYGSTDANGVYWIDAGGSHVRITNSRLGCTLAIYDASSIELTGAIVWEYAAVPEAILVADAPIYFNAIEPVLSESTLGVNFNPSSSPFRGSISNTTIDDQYDTQFRGLIYSSDDVTVYATSDGSPIWVTGSVIGDDVTLYNDVHIFSLPELVSSPPAGLIDPTPMRFINGTMRRVPTP